MSFESTDTFYSAEVQPRTSKPNDDQQTLEKLDNAVNNDEFLWYISASGIEKIYFKTINDFVDKIINVTNKKKYESCA